MESWNLTLTSAVLEPPPWHALNIRDEFTAFVPVYERRPGSSNEGGAGFFHYFALWCAIKSISPDTIIESGIHNGVGTWFLRQAAGDAKLILISPDAPSIYKDQAKHTKYYTGVDFQDFNLLAWKDILPDKSRAFIFFDDHQAGIRRIQEARTHGFRYIMFDDNYIPGRGDNLSPKKVCNLALYDALGNAPFVYQDNFNKIQRPLARSELVTHMETFEHSVHVYAEFPPVWSGPNRFDVPDAVWMDISMPPIIQDATEIGFSLSRQIFEARRYTHISFIELKPRGIYLTTSNITQNIT